jgi:hypothetical protein
MFNGNQVNKEKTILPMIITGAHQIIFSLDGLSSRQG